MKRRLFSLILAVCLMVGLSIPALADQMAVPATVTTSVSGTVRVQNIDVTVPTTISFILDPSVDGSQVDYKVSGFAQVTQPDISISNNSATTIYIGITEFTHSFVDAEKVSDLGKDNALAFGLTLEGDKQLVMDFFPDNGGSMAGAYLTLYMDLLEDAAPLTGGGGRTSLAGGESRKLLVAARGDPSVWQPDDTFSATVVFTVSTDISDIKLS